MQHTDGLLLDEDDDGDDAGLDALSQADTIADAAADDSCAMLPPAAAPTVPATRSRAQMSRQELD